MRSPSSDSNQGAAAGRAAREEGDVDEEEEGEGFEEEEVEVFIVDVDRFFGAGDDRPPVGKRRVLPL